MYRLFFEVILSVNEEINVRLDDIGNLFVDMMFNCDEAGSFDFAKFDENNSEQVDKLIRKYILSRYNQLGCDEKKWLKLSLSYFLTYEPSQFCKLSKDGYIPIKVSFELMEKVWTILFFNESYAFKGKPNNILYDV